MGLLRASNTPHHPDQFRPLSSESRRRLIVHTETCPVGTFLTPSTLCLYSIQCMLWWCICQPTSRICVTRPSTKGTDDQISGIYFLVFVQCGRSMILDSCMLPQDVKVTWGHSAVFNTAGIVVSSGVGYGIFRSSYTKFVLLFEYWHILCIRHAAALVCIFHW